MSDITLTKSDFLDYVTCDKALWLRKKQPDTIEWPAPSAFDRMLMEDGYAVEVVVRDFVAKWDDSDRYSFQSVFKSPDGLFARADLVRSNEDGSIDIWEIKASTSLKGNGKDHVMDATFQTLVAKRSGSEVRKIGVIHVNGDYEHGDELAEVDFLRFTDVTDDAASRLAEITDAADAALNLLAMDEIDTNGCSCILKSKGQHCSAFRYFNPGVEPPSIFDIPRLSAKRRALFVAEGRISLRDIDPDEVTALQAPVVQAAREDSPVINAAGIDKFLSQLSYPLHFYDYETFASALPMSPGVKPHEAVPVQVSLHTLLEDGSLTHAECLTDQPGQHQAIVDFLNQHIGPDGNLIAWNMSFEKSCNRTLARLVPAHADMLADLNDRTVDLMDVFKADYVDPRFQGSTSIKKVLPVLVPHLNYDEDSVHDGAGAMEAWKSLFSTVDPQEREQIRQQLLAYCQLDSLAMVEIFQFLKAS
jgi:CRISPR/Cas system-associated exonuclease Cas4 (RecB family)